MHAYNRNNINWMHYNQIPIIYAARMAHRHYKRDTGKKGRKECICDKSSVYPFVLHIPATSPLVSPLCRQIHAHIRLHIAMPCLCRCHCRQVLYIRCRANYIDNCKSLITVCMAFCFGVVLCLWCTRMGCALETTAPILLCGVRSVLYHMRFSN